MYVHTHHGVLFRDFVAAMVRAKRARRYLEVGVRDGATLALIDCDAIGVDPDFQFTMNPMGRKSSLHLYQKTSDAFFREHDARAIAGGALDVVFLDGLHQFEYLLRDVISSEAACHRDSLIMLDDCLPVNAEMTERKHDPSGRVNQDFAGWWTGDVWKLLPILRKYRPDLRMTVVDTAPTGTICLTNLDPASTVLKDKYYQIVDEFLGLVLDDAALARFYSETPIVSSAAIMADFNASLFVGP